LSSSSEEESKDSTPKHIPGFYYDEKSKAYFRTPKDGDLVSIEASQRMQQREKEKVIIHPYEDQKLHRAIKQTLTSCCCFMVPPCRR
jgi:hypothetical protein